MVVALDGESLNGRSLAEVIKPTQQSVSLTIVRPGPPYNNPQLHQLETKAELAVVKKKETVPIGGSLQRKNRASRRQLRKLLRLTNVGRHVVVIRCICGVAGAALPTPRHRLQLRSGHRLFLFE